MGSCQLHPFRFPRVAQKELDGYNRRVGALLDSWYRCSGAAWTPGMIVPPELRWRMDTFVPWREVRTALAALARKALPSQEWLPRMLWRGSLESVVEWWEELPEYAGRLRLAADELLPCLCACADPPRYGTTLGRYPEQLAALERLLPPGGTMVDLGCGVGLGTLEAAGRLRMRRCLGVTLEPLEAWMANERRLPHDSTRTAMFHGLAETCVAEFLPGDATGFECNCTFDLVMCNGLAGGRFLQEEAHMEAFVRSATALIAPRGVLAMANSFHPGQQAAVERLAKIAQNAGLEPLSLDWRNLIFQR